MQDDRPANGTKARHSRSVLPPSKAYDPRALKRQIGILRIVAEDGATCPQYIWRGRPAVYWVSSGNTSTVLYDLLWTTIDRQETLVVCFIPSPTPHLIGCLVKVSQRCALCKMPQFFLCRTLHTDLEISLFAIPLQVTGEVI